MLKGKYTTRRRFYRVRLQRALLRTVLRRLHKWAPLREPRPGYTILIPCHHRLPEVLLPNLDLVAKQGLENLDRTVISFDTIESDRLREIAGRLEALYPQLCLEFRYQTPRQAAIIWKIGWAWVDIWLSYCKCLSAARTRYAMLHDMDAMLLRPGIVEERFAAMSRRGVEFLGTHWYIGNGNEAEDEMCFPVEMFVDVAFLRGRFKPVDMFNHVCMWNGRTVDFDVMLFPQTRGRRSLMPMPGEDMVHPGQVISQYVFLLSKAGYIPPERNNLFFIPYFLHLAGNQHVLLEHTQALEGALRTGIPFLGRRLNLVNLSALQVDWVEKQFSRVEQAIAGQMRPDVARYLRAIRRHAGGGSAGAAV